MMIKEMMIIMTTIMMMINSKTKRITIERMFLITKNVVIKIVTLSNLLTIKEKS